MLASRKILLSLMSSIYLVSCSLPKEKIVLSAPIKIPDLHLDYFLNEHRNILINYFTVSSEWHVAPINGTVIAIKRRSGIGCYPVSIPLPSSYPNRKIPYLGNSFFNLNSGISQPSSDVVLENKATEKNWTSLKMNQYNDGSKSSYLILENKDKGIKLEVFENSEDNFRKSTSEYLLGISQELEKLINTSPKVGQDIDRKILPSESIKYIPKETFQIQFISPGVYSISGYVNRGEKGFIYLKVIDNNTGKLLISDSEGSNAEYVGWSKNQREKFKFCLGVFLMGGTHSPPQRLSEFQILFHPSNGGADKIINRQNILTKIYVKP